MLQLKSVPLKRIVAFQTFLRISWWKTMIQICIEPHFKAFCMMNLQYEIRICQKKYNIGTMTMSIFIRAVIDHMTSYNLNWPKINLWEQYFVFSCALDHILENCIPMIYKIRYILEELYVAVIWIISRLIIYIDQLNTALVTKS